MFQVFDQLVGTGRFELPTPRTPSECSTRLSHVPTQGSRPREGRRGVPFCKSTRVRRSCGPAYALGGTYSAGRAAPSPKKNSCICSTRKLCACGVQGWRRYSLSSIFCRSPHSAQAAFETFLKIL